MGILLTWIFASLSVVAGAYLLPSVSVESFGVAMIVALVLGIIAVTIKPVLKLLTLPINILTLGLFSLVLNALLLMLVDYLVSGFNVGGFISALLMSLIMSFVMVVLESLVKEEK